MVEVSRDGRRVYVTNSLYARVGRAVLPGGDRRLAGQARRRRGRLAGARPRPLRGVQRRAARTRCGCRAATPRRTRTASRTSRLMDTLAAASLLALLGAYHGLNPAMGWLFAVALGMQERDRARGAARAAADRDRPRAGDRPWSPCSCSASGCSPTPRRCTSAPAIALSRSASSASPGRARTPRWTTMRVNRARADLVVVPDVERPRRRADGRAGADRRRRGRQRGATRRTASRRRRRGGDRASLDARSRLLLHVGAMLAVMGVIVRRSSTTSSGWRPAPGVAQPRPGLGRRVRRGAGVLTLFT